MNERIQLFGVEIDRLSAAAAAERVLGWSTAPRGAACRFVVTPNVDHTVMLQESADLRAAYEDASLVLADGWPVVAASRLLGRSLPERVTGSDLVPNLFSAAQQPLSLYLLGAMPGVAERAAANVHAQWSNVSVVGTYSPPFGFEKDAAETASIIEKINACQPDVLVVGLGAPKQELWVHRYHREIDAKVALCVGATIDFLAGEKSRAPQWIQRCGLEWCHRMLSEPRRLAKRYARDAWIFPRLVLREWRASL